ncbi:MAG TPA: hypothetical protein VGF28_18935 [Thermoanaerobaculia bacterium]|jgi:hypothetical protein
MTDGSPKRRVPPKITLVALLAIWLIALTATHFGEDSPYSYGWAIFDNYTHLMYGVPTNPDARFLIDFTYFFYEGAQVNWAQAQNLKLPLHSFSVSMAGAFTHSYLASNLIVNVVFAVLVALAAVTLALRWGTRPAATLVALLSFFSLPLYVEYLGQPMQYIVGPAVSFIVVMSIVAFEPEDARNPWIAGLATSILTLNYDPYVFLAALVTWFLFVSRFPRWRDYLFFAIAAGTPYVAWSRYLDFISDGQMTRHLHNTFIAPVLKAWVDFITFPTENVLLPFIASHVGVHVAFHQIIAMIYWPLLFAALALVVWLRPRIGTEKRFVLPALFPVFLFLEQIVAAGWDWELNPRRAIPVVLAFGFAYVYAVDRMWHSRTWRVTFVALMLLSMVLATADTLFRNPAMAFTRTGQAMKLSPQEAIPVGYRRLGDRFTMRKYVPNSETILWRDMGRARKVPRERLGIFAATQALCLYLLLGMLWLAARAKILPRWSPLAAAGVWVASLVRFL